MDLAHQFKIIPNLPLTHKQWCCIISDQFSQVRGNHSQYRHHLKRNPKQGRTLDKAWLRAFRQETFVGLSLPTPLPFPFHSPEGQKSLYNKIGRERFEYFPRSGKDFNLLVLNESFYKTFLKQRQHVWCWDIMHLCCTCKKLLHFFISLLLLIVSDGDCVVGLCEFFFFFFGF